MFSNVVCSLSVSLNLSGFMHLIPFGNASFFSSILCLVLTELYISSTGYIVSLRRITKFAGYVSSAAFCSHCCFLSHINDKSFLFKCLKQLGYQAWFRLRFILTFSITMLRGMFHVLFSLVSSFLFQAFAFLIGRQSIHFWGKVIIRLNVNWSFVDGNDYWLCQRGSALKHKPFLPGKICHINKVAWFELLLTNLSGFYVSWRNREHLKLPAWIRGFLVKSSTNRRRKVTASTQQSCQITNKSVSFWIDSKVYLQWMPHFSCIYGYRWMFNESFMLCFKAVKAWVLSVIWWWWWISFPNFSNFLVFQTTEKLIFHCPY